MSVSVGCDALPKAGCVSALVKTKFRSQSRDALLSRSRQSMKPVLDDAVIAVLPVTPNWVV